MKKWPLSLFAVLALVGFQHPASADEAALKPCKNCHDITPAKKTIVGPPLFGVFGGKPTIDGVPFEVWDEKSLDAWEKNPQAVKKKAKMLFRTPNEAKRKAIIEALKELK